jgi:hypothetical protein
MTIKRQSGESITSKSERPRCGAKTRVGGHCKAPAVWNTQDDVARNGRCRMHGGLSTGPRTEEGLQRTLKALRAGRVRWLR